MPPTALNITENRPLKDFTTFKIGGPARYFIEVEELEDLEPALDFAKNLRLPVLILGGGSNMLVSDSGYPGVVIFMNWCGIDLWTKDEITFFIRPHSGEAWDDVVKFAVMNGFWGIENLSRIPGQAGAFAVQNVGAYGVEAADVVESVLVFDRTDGEQKKLSKEECGFAYRTSIFNTTEKGRYIILATTLKLSEHPKPRLGYPDLQRKFADNALPTLQQIRDAIIEIRDSKFPFPAESIEGNAGSFFKNPLLTEAEYAALEKMFEKNLPESLERLRTLRNKFPMAGAAKIPGAFILEACGLKGFELGQAKLNPAQPVVLLNKTGHASAIEILSLLKEVRSVVREKTGLHLLTEPELIGFTESELRRYGFNDQEIERYIHQAH